MSNPIPLSNHRPLPKHKQTIADHFGSATDYNTHATVQKQVCELLLSKIKHHEQTSVLEIGAGSGQLTQLLANQLHANQLSASEWHINELSAKQADKLANILPTAQLHIGDAEQLELSNNHSLIISANAIQWFDNPLNFIEQSSNRLAKGGQLLFNTFTPNNLYQIKQLTGQGLAYPSEQQWRAEIGKQGLMINEISTHVFELHFDSPYQVLQHIKQTGVTTSNTTNHNAQNKFIWTKAKLEQFTQAYQQLFGNPDVKDGKVVLTYEVLLLDLTKP